MSKLLLSQLKTIKPLVKAKGLEFEQYGMIENGILYFNNGVVEVSVPVDIPFDTTINLHELLTLLQVFAKEEFVIVQHSNGSVSLTCNDNTYWISVLLYPLDIVRKFNNIPQHKVDSAVLFPFMVNVATSYIQNAVSEHSIDVKNFLYVVDNVVTVTDRSNMLQCNLDYGMPNLAFNLSQCICMDKLLKSTFIVALDLIDNTFVMQLNNGVTVYVENLFNTLPENILGILGRIDGLFEKHYNVPTFKFPPYVGEQSKVLEKLSDSKVVFFNSTFIQIGQNKIDYPKIENCPDDFAMRTTLKNANMFFTIASGANVNIADNGVKNSAKFLFCQSSNIRALFAYAQEC